MKPLNSKELELASILLSNQQALGNFFQYSNNPRFLKFLLGENLEQRNIFLQGIPIEETEHGEFLFPMAYLVRIAERLHAGKATINNDIYIEYINYIHQALLSIIKGYSLLTHQNYPAIITQTIQILLLIGIEHMDAPIQYFLISSIKNGWLENISWQLKDLLSALIVAKHPFSLDLCMVVIEHLPEESSSQSNIYYSLETIFQDTTILGVLSSFCGRDFIINLSKKLTEILWVADNRVSDENFIMTLSENATVKVEISALGLNFNLPYVPSSLKRQKLIPILEQQLSSLEENNKGRIIEKILHYYTYIWQDYSYIFYNDLYKNIDITLHFDKKCFLIYLLKETLSYTLQQQGEETFQNIYQEITSDSKFFIFKRILLYCYGMNFSIVRENLFQLLSEEKSILFSEPFEAEIYHFFENNLSSFSDNEKELIKKLIDEGPYEDLAWLPEEAQKHYQQEAVKNYWKQKQFVSLVKDPEFAKAYQKLKEQTGEKEFFNFRDGFSFKPVTYIPLLKDDEALQLIINNTSAYLKKIHEFEPLGARARQAFLDEKPSNEGNIKQLQRLAKDHPIEIATRISYLRSLRPIYIVQIFEGLKESSKVDILDWSALLAFISSYLENIPAAPSENLETHFFEIKKGEEAKQIVRAFAEALPDKFQKTTIDARQVVEALIKFLSSLLDTYSFQHAAFIIEEDKKRPVSYLESSINTCFGRALEKLLRIIVLNPECANQQFQDFYTKCLNKKVVEAYLFLGFYFTDLEHRLPEWSNQQANSLLAPDQDDGWDIFFEGFLKKRIKCLTQYESMFAHYEKAIKMGSSEYQDLLAEEFTGFFLYGKDTLDNKSLISICYQNKSFSLINNIISCISRDINRILHQQDKLTEEQKKEKQNLLEKANQLWNFIWHKMTDPPVQDTPISLLSAMGGLIPSLHSLEENEYQQILQILQHYPPKIRPWDSLIPNLLFLVKTDRNADSACFLGKIYLEIIKKIDFPFPKNTHAEVIQLLEQFHSNADVKTVYEDIRGEYVSKHWLNDFFHFFQTTS